MISSVENDNFIFVNIYCSCVIIGSCCLNPSLVLKFTADVVLQSIIIWNAKSSLKRLLHGFLTHSCNSYLCFLKYSGYFIVKFANLE